MDRMFYEALPVPPTETPTRRATLRHTGHVDLDALSAALHTERFSPPPEARYRRMYSLSSVGGVFECRIANPSNLPPKGKYKGHNDMCGETSQPQPFHIAPNLVSSDILGRPNLAFERPLQTRNRHSQRPPRGARLVHSEWVLSIQIYTRLLLPSQSTR